MRASHMAAMIGKTGTMRQGDFTLAVTVQDARVVFGRVDYLVSVNAPSHGEAWVDAARVKVEVKEEADPRPWKNTYRKDEV